MRGQALIHYFISAFVNATALVGIGEDRRLTLPLANRGVRQSLRLLAKTRARSYNKGTEFIFRPRSSRSCGCDRSKLHGSSSRTAGVNGLSAPPVARTAGCHGRVFILNRPQER